MSRRPAQLSRLHRGVGNVPRRRGGKRRLQLAYRRDRLLPDASVTDRRGLVLFLAIRPGGISGLEGGEVVEKCYPTFNAYLPRCE